MTVYRDDAPSRDDILLRGEYSTGNMSYTAWSDYLSDLYGLTELDVYQFCRNSGHKDDLEWFINEPSVKKALIRKLERMSSKGKSDKFDEIFLNLLKSGSYLETF